MFRIPKPGRSLLVPIAAVVLTAAASGPGYVLMIGGSEILIGDGRARISIPAGGIQMGFDYERDSLWMANSSSRSYWQGTVAEYCAESKRTQDAMMEQMMSRLTPQQRAMMEQHTKGSDKSKSGESTADTTPVPPPKVTFEPTTETATIAGHQTRKVRVLADGKLHQEIWFTTDTTIRVGNFVKMRVMQEQMRECVTGEMEAQQDREMQRIGAIGRWNVDRQGIREKVKRSRAIQATPEYEQAMRGGFPLKIVLHDMPNAQPMIVEKLERREVDASDLAPPKGYRRGSIMEVMGGPPR